MSKMAPLLGRDITERMFLPRFCEMLTDPLFHVRKVSCLLVAGTSVLTSAFHTFCCVWQTPKLRKERKAKHLAVKTLKKLKYFWDFKKRRSKTAGNRHVCFLSLHHLTLTVAAGACMWFCNYCRLKQFVMGLVSMCRFVLPTLVRCATLLECRIVRKFW